MVQLMSPPFFGSVVLKAGPAQFGVNLKNHPGVSLFQRCLDDMVLWNNAWERLKMGIYDTVAMNVGTLGEVWGIRLRSVYSAGLSISGLGFKSSPGWKFVYLR